MTNLVKMKERKGYINRKHQNEIITEFTPLIKYIASKMVMKTRHTTELNEMISYGVIGLIDAIGKYDPKHDNKFKTYAEYRIRGAMLDYLREQDFLPRSARDRVKAIEKAKSELEIDLGRKPEYSEIAEKLNITNEEFFEADNYLRNITFLSVEDTTRRGKETLDSVINIYDENESANPAAKVSFDNIRQMLNSSVTALPERERQVISLYYYEELNLKEIAAKLNVSESRVSQIHSKAVHSLKALLDDVKEDLDIAA